MVGGEYIYMGIEELSKDEARNNEDLLKKINALDVDERERFDGLFIDHFNDSYWCRVNGINYVNPNIAEIGRASCRERV